MNDKVKKLKWLRDVQYGLLQARATGGCQRCFKPHDPAAPSCNQHECVARWNERCAAAIRAIPAAARKD